MKVYLAKSNRANPSDLITVRGELKKLEGIEIVEYSGGTYSHDSLSVCDYLVIVPQSNESPIILGKGLYEQIVELPVAYLVVSGSNPIVRMVAVNWDNLEVFDSYKPDYIRYAKYDYRKDRIQKLEDVFPQETIILL
jgi:hypothetical protein